MKDRVKNILYWILGLFFPIIGLIIYFVSEKRTEKSKSIISGTIVGILIFIVVCIIINIIPSDNNDIDVVKTPQDWYSEVSDGKLVLTIYGSTTCPHCQEYKPVIKDLSKKYKFNYYFFELDSLSEEDEQLLLNSFELKDFDGHVPFTFVMNNKEYKSSLTGFESEERIIDYLKENGIIKN